MSEQKVNKLTSFAAGISLAGRAIALACILLSAASIYSAPNYSQYLSVPKNTAVIEQMMGRTEISAADIALYGKIFELQAQAKWDEADDATQQLQDKTLLGHVLAARYEDDRYAKDYTELSLWLAQYSDLPQARKIYVMARAKHPSGEPMPHAPHAAWLQLRSHDDSLTTTLRSSGSSTAWRNGLDDYRQGKYENAAKQFVSLLDENLPPSDRSAVAFWAWRSYQAADNSAAAAPYLVQAAQEPRSFYGILARKAMKRDLDIARDATLLSDSARRTLLAAPALHRAELLVKVGETKLAEKEIEAAFAQTQDGDILKLAGEWNLASLQMRLGGALAEGDGARDAALYPTPDWNSAGNHAVNPALLFAIARQESKFNEKATSRSGALGLMQLMPGTAHSMAQRSHLGFTTAELRHELYEPETNMKLGQNYIRYLMNEGIVGKNLVFLVAAYNAGPGNLQDWKKSIDYKQDPLLFIELIPSAETRNYVVNVMANYWIYSSLLGAHGASAVALLEKRWPVYQSENVELAGIPQDDNNR